MRKIGAHVSISGGLDKAVKRAQKMGANTIQIFSGSPRSWARKMPNQPMANNFKKLASKNQVSPVFVHSLYLINLATNKPELLKKSQKALEFDLKFCNLIGAQGAIFHLGSHQGRGLESVKDQIVKTCQQVLKNIPGPSQLILENTAPMGGKVGATFEELAYLINKINSDRVKICLDSAHLFTSKYPTSTQAELKKTIKEFTQKIGTNRLVCIHLNDSMEPAQSGKDRHANIGQGHLGLRGIANWLNHPPLKSLPFIIETPGFNNQGPDKKNLDILKGLVD